MDCIKHIVVYDDYTEDDKAESDAIECANKYISWGSRYPVQILQGGYFEFSKKYSFLRSIISQYSPRELFSQIKVTKNF